MDHESCRGEGGGREGGGGEGGGHIMYVPPVNHLGRSHQEWRLQVQDRYVPVGLTVALVATRAAEHDIKSQETDVGKHIHWFSLW